MNGYIHLSKNKENKNRYHVMLSLVALLHKVMCLKKYRYPRIIAETMAAIFGYQSPWQIIQLTVNQLLPAGNQVYYSFQSKMASVSDEIQKSPSRGLGDNQKSPPWADLSCQIHSPYPTSPLQINIDGHILWVISKS